jgi:adenylate cyclase
LSEQSEQQYEGLPRRVWGLIIGGGTWLVLFLAQLGENSPSASYIEQLENKALDSRFQLRADWAPTVADDRIMILTADQEALDYMEHRNLAEGFDELDFNEPWPWKRDRYGRLANFLAEMGAESVFFDFLWTARSGYDWDGYEGDSDLLAKNAGQAEIVFFPLFFEEEQSTGDKSADTESESVHDKVTSALLEVCPTDKLRASTVAGPPGAIPRYRYLQVPIPILARAAAGLGAVNAAEDDDGINRRVGLLYGHGEDTYGSIPLALARRHLAEGKESWAPSESEYVITPIEGDSASTSMGPPMAETSWDCDSRTVQVGDVSIPVDRQGRLLINWHPNDAEFNTSYSTMSLHKVFLDLEDWENGVSPANGPEFFKDKIVLIGTSATGLGDLKATPVNSLMPGVEVHATALDNILNEDFIHRPDALARHAGALLLFLIAGAFFVRKQSARLSALAFIGLLVATTGGSVWLFVAQGMWLDMVIPGVGLVLIFAEAQTVQYFTEGRQKRQIRSVFQRYLPPTVVNEVLKVPIDQLKLGGDRLELTVSFSDIEGFTSISEHLEAEQLVSMLNVYLSEMSNIVSRSGGTLDKYIGDCIMAFWGAPLPVENGAVQSCYAALDCNDRLTKLRQEFVEQGLPEIHARIGINTGEMLVGNMGSDSHFSYTVMGDAVNLASRLEGANKQYGSYLMIGELTYERAKEAIEVRTLDWIKVKGKSKPVQVYELMSRKGALDTTRERLRSVYEEGVALYRAREWQQALEKFRNALTIVPKDGPSDTYRKRCESFTATPPPEDWNGVFTMTTK